MSVQSELKAQGKFIQKNSQFIFYEMPMLCIYNEKNFYLSYSFYSVEKTRVFFRVNKLSYIFGSLG